MGDTIFDPTHRFIEQALASLTLLQKEHPDDVSFVGRELALVRTKLEEASLWLYQAENQQGLKECNIQ